MGKVMAGMTISLDGFMADENKNAGKLSPDFDELLEAPTFRQRFLLVLFINTITEVYVQNS